MTIKTLVSPDGEFDPTVFNNLHDDPEQSISVITTLGCHGREKADILDNLFDTNFSNSSQLGITTSFVLGDDAAVFTNSPRNFVVMNVESHDNPSKDRDELRERIYHLSIALSDVVLFVLGMNDLARPQTNGITTLRASLTQTLLLQADGLVPLPHGKRAFFVLVRDYEPDVIARQEVISGFLQDMQAMYNNVAKPPGSAPRVTDVFTFEFLLLPSERYSRAEFNTEIASIRSKIRDPASDNFLFEDPLYARNLSMSLNKAAENAWSKLDKEQNQEMPPTKDLMSSFDCDNAMRKVFEKYQRSVRVWRRETEGGVVLDSFGREASNMVKKTLAVFDDEAAPHKGSLAFKRKKEELKDLLDADLYELFVVQIAKLREVTYRMFKDKMDAIEEGDPNLERQVNSTLKEGQKSFRQNAEALRPKSSGWRYENDVKELSVQMREDSTERLQRARIADQEQGGRRNRRRRNAVNPGRKSRQPISLSFHYLDPAPLGFKDSRFEKLTFDDNVQYSENAGTSNSSGVSESALPLMPSRDSGWRKKNQEFIYTERK